MLNLSKLSPRSFTSSSSQKYSAASVPILSSPPSAAIHQRPIVSVSVSYMVGGKFAAVSQAGRQTSTMAGGAERNSAVRCPRCEVCGVVIRVRGIEREGAICKDCLSGVLPFVGIVSESDFKAAVREYKEGLQSRAGQFQGLWLDPFDDEMREVLKQLDETLRGCAYMGGEEIKGYLKKVAKNGGCSLSLLCYNIRSAKGPGLELLEAEI